MSLTCPPRLLTASILISGVVTGMQMTALQPWTSRSSQSGKFDFQTADCDALHLAMISIKLTATIRMAMTLAVA